MCRTKKIPVFMDIELSQRNYDTIHDMAHNRQQSFATTIQNLIELGILTVSEYDKEVVYDD